MTIRFEELARRASRVVARLQTRLPPEIAPLARGVPVHYESAPSESILAEGFEPDILGLFSGNPYGSDFRESDPAPPQIFLYLENLWDFAEGDLRVFREELRVTYLHELGHYLGWDEEELAVRGLD
ncbi:hypothetical protein AXK12_05720 [Cephaloticoccus capnophilus]|uniref:Metallopeptidase family protein n=1 Tax=Cephaloticoccus capnophilus TaxID=1548208 RepID=A0A139SKX0_9BACT|nr:metallopeptidase family protein [Cephaloticoccus capnophilus]KXU35202.1 hypothetical protein AXK12_05720 [Cephaloticoccus capnophilus]